MKHSSSPLYEIKPHTPYDEGSFIVSVHPLQPISRQEVFEDLVKNAVPEAKGFNIRLVRPGEYAEIEGVATTGFNGSLLEQHYKKTEAHRRTISLLGRLSYGQLRLPTLRQ